MSNYVLSRKAVLYINPDTIKKAVVVPPLPRAHTINGSDQSSLTSLIDHINNKTYTELVAAGDSNASS